MLELQGIRTIENFIVQVILVSDHITKSLLLLENTKLKHLFVEKSNTQGYGIPWFI